jgi:7-carboxy-7-deazaguanine synthase
MKLNRIKDYDKILPIVEVYTCIQSEGSRAGYPTICVRTTGCTHRCFFREGGWCDSWYTSIHPEKGKYSLNDIIKMYDENPHIKEMMLTGGSPTMHGDLVNELTYFAANRGIFITIETEGSHFLETDNAINLLSISPKFTNSIPTLGVKTPQGKIVDQKFIDQHNKLRMNIGSIAKMIYNHDDFHIKPVIDKDLSILPEVEMFLDKLSDELLEIALNDELNGESLSIEDKYEILEYLKSKTWCMPAGDTREALVETYPIVMNMCRDKGYKFTGRAHIISFDIEREV